MPTKYDVFAKLIEKGPCKESDLGFKTEVYVHLKELVKNKFVRMNNNIYSPIKNSKTISIFKIIKYCIKSNLDYNLFFSRNMIKILFEINQNIPILRPNKLKNNRDILEVLNYLESNQFILVHNKRPTLGILLRHQLFENIINLNNSNFSIKEPNFFSKKIEEKIMKIKGKPVNPFHDNVFSFLAGSAQLEGATISAGETKELLINEIYPNKPQKDIQMVKNLNEALLYILDNLDEKITSEHIKKLNYLVMFSMHRNAGKYKLIENKIQGNPNFKISSVKEVPNLIESYIDKLNLINKKNILFNLGYIHNQLQYIHPFADGNSRTTRMVVNWLMLKNNLPLIVLKMGCFDEYMSLTKLSKKRDDDKLNYFFWNILVHEDINSL